MESEAGGHCRTGVTGWENIWLWRVWVGQRRASIIIVEDCVVQQLTENIPVQRWVKIFEGFTLRGGRQFCVESAWSGGIKTMYLGCNAQDKD